MSDFQNEDEFYEDATESFPSVADLIPVANNTIKGEVAGRLVGIWAAKNGMQKKDDGSTYPYTEGTVIVLDNGPDGDQATDLIGEAPQEVYLRFSTTGTQSRLTNRVEGMTKVKRDEDGKVMVPARPQRFLPMFGRINARPSTKHKGGNPAIGISAPTDADREIIRRYKAEIVEISQRMEAKEHEREEAEAFG